MEHMLHVSQPETASLTEKCVMRAVVKGHISQMIPGALSVNVISSARRRGWVGGDEVRVRESG